ncbi:MAG: YraN family protein [Holosporales bacterium]|jgi:putative endonuclease|nr:YraN family protein [Holosporales bacterium]
MIAYAENNLRRAPITIHNFDEMKKKYQNVSRNSLSTYEKGISSEFCASKLLISKGYKILHFRMRNMYGEIDIIAQKNDVIVAVEVKQRKTLDSSKESITYRQKRRISEAFLLFISERNEMFETYRIDVVCFDSNGRFEHIENAFYIEEAA